MSAPIPKAAPEADLLIALSELHAHNALIDEANEKMDFALSRVLDEQQIGYLEAVADAADALLGGQIVVSIHVETAYVTGYELTHTMSVAVPAPAEGEDLADWAAPHILVFTGTRPDHANVEALYGVAVTACDARPELIGVTTSAQG